MKMKEIVQKVLTKKELEIMPTAFDTVGNIIIFNFFPEELKKKEKKIGEEIIKKLKHVETVAKKIGKYSGVYRTPTIRLVAGKRSKETIHRENGVKLKLHVEKVYFSARTAMEREKVFRMVKRNEEVLVMFSGIGPLPIEIAKHSKAKCVGVEINPFAHEYAVENAKLNNVGCEFICGDVNKVLPKLDKKFDRILMPLPKSAEDFLNLALSKVKRNGVVQLYAFVYDHEIKNFEKKLKEITSEKGNKIKVKNIDRCGQFSPGQYRMRFDIIKA